MAAEVPFGSLAAALGRPAAEDPAAEFESVMRELFALETQTREAADMIERSARELPELADLLNGGLRRPVLAALTEYLGSRARSGALRATPDAAATARLVLETLTWFARHRHWDPDGAAIPDDLAATPPSTRSSTPSSRMLTSEDAHDAADGDAGARGHG